MDILIDNNYEGKLIREVLKKDLGYSVNLIKKLKFAENGILVNGQWVTVRYELKHGDVLSLAVEDKPEDVSPYIIPTPLENPAEQARESTNPKSKRCFPTESLKTPCNIGRNMV
jgi:pSer/pThr/pTyr-binding forkhead associated (FHA) protein